MGGERRQEGRAGCAGGRREEERPCLQSPGCWWGPAGALSELTLRELVRLPDHLPQPGVPSRSLGRKFLPGKPLSLILAPFSPPPRFLQATVGAASLTRTWQPLLPTCRGTLPAERPANASCLPEVLPCWSPRPQLCSGLMSWEHRWAAHNLPQRPHQVP